MFDRERVMAAIGIFLVVAFFSGIGLFMYDQCKNGACSTEPSYSAPAQPQAKPATKTRCDYGGVMTSSIIAEEAANGYQFAGRIKTWYCDNGLSFYLRQPQ